MASLKNIRHEKFAQCAASGLTGADAYRQVMNYTGKEADGNAANWDESPRRPRARQRTKGSQLPEGDAKLETDILSSLLKPAPTGSYAGGFLSPTPHYLRGRVQNMG